MFGNTESTRKADDRVRQTLDELEIQYVIDDDFDFCVSSEVEAGRSQAAIIRSQTVEFLGIEIREVSSVGLTSQGPFDARTANILLQQNNQLKIGAWGVVAYPGNDTHLAVFTVKIAAEIGAQEFLGILHAVLITADEMENRLSGRDDF